jgi:alpha-1,2-mannosyltransferase
MSRRRDLAAVAGLCSLFGLAGWAFYLHSFADVPGEGWMVYDNAVRAYFEGHLPLLYDGERSTALLNARFAGWLPHPLPLHPWLYPPHYLLLLLPFGLMPFALSGGMFLVLGLAGLFAASRHFARRGRERAVFAASVLLCPASAMTICVGQNSFLTCALLLGGFGSLARRPVIGGALLGLLTYKPQLWLMVPVALVAARQWKALAAAAAAALLLAGSSVAVFGLEPWRAWFELMLAPSPLIQEWTAIARLNGQSVYANAILLGAAVPLANLAQAAAALSAAGCVWWCYRRPIAADLGLAVLLAATMLAAPHVIGYDGVLLGIAATLFFNRAYEDGFRFGDTAIAVLVWASPLANPPSVFVIGFLTPLLILGFIAWVMARARRDAARIASGRVLSPA